VHKLLIALTALVCAAPVLAANGGPDSFGYRWIDNRGGEAGAPAYSWANTGGGTGVSFSDDTVRGPYNIGFTFSFYGRDYTQVWVSSNGFLTFEQNANSGCCSGSAMGQGRGFAAMVAGFWTDMYPSSGQVRTLGAPGNRTFVFQHTGREYSNRGTIEYQIHLSERSQSVTIMLRNCAVVGHTVGVGIQNSARNVGMTYLTGNNQSVSNRAVTFIRNAPPRIAPVQPIVAYRDQRVQFLVAASDPDDDPLTLSAAGLPNGSIFNTEIGKFRWTPTADDVGAHAITFRVEEQRNDGQPPLFDEIEVPIEVFGLNRPPEITSTPPASVVQGERFEYTVVAHDVDSDDPVTCSITEAPESAEFVGCSVGWVGAGQPGDQVPFSLRVVDAEGAGRSQVFTVELEASAMAPIARVVQLDNKVGPGWVSLDGRSSEDPSHTSLRYAWRALSWPDVAEPSRIEAPTEAETRGLVSYRGEYRFQLTVHNDLLGSAPVEVGYEVVNVAPVADPGEDFEVRLAADDEVEIELDGSNSRDPNPEDTFECDWAQVEGPIADLRPSGLRAEVTLSGHGVHVFSLTCRDDELEGEPALLNVDVYDPNPPVVRPPAPPPGASGCGCTTGSPLGLVWLAVMLALRRRRPA
jgi:MYXO-CTERM domain-containing protein